MQLAALCVIQCVAFLQTLCRKRLLSHAGFLVVYGALLALGLAVVFAELSERRVLGLAAALANGAALARLDGGANKFVLWAAVAAAWPALASTAESRAWWLVVAVSTLAIGRNAIARGVLVGGTPDGAVPRAGSTKEGKETDDGHPRK